MLPSSLYEVLSEDDVSVLLRALLIINQIEQSDGEVSLLARSLLPRLALLGLQPPPAPPTPPEPPDDEDEHLWGVWRVASQSIFSAWLELEDDDSVPTRHLELLETSIEPLETCSICLCDLDEALSREVGPRYSALSARLPPAALRAVAEFENYLIVWLPCGHGFHYDCAATWDRQCKGILSCPLCRAEVNGGHVAAADALAVSSTTSSVIRSSPPTTPRRIATPLQPNFTEQSSFRSGLWDMEELFGV